MDGDKGETVSVHERHEDATEEIVKGDEEDEGEETGDARDGFDGAFDIDIFWMLLVEGEIFFGKIDGDEVDDRDRGEDDGEK